jgi:hypothetical protein
MVSTVITIYNQPYGFQGQPWTRPKPFYFLSLFHTFLFARPNNVLWQHKSRSSTLSNFLNPPSSDNSPLRNKLSDTISINTPPPHIGNQVRHPHKTGKCFNVTTMKIGAACSSPRNVRTHVPAYSLSHPVQTVCKSTLLRYQQLYKTLVKPQT